MLETILVISLATVVVLLPVIGAARDLLSSSPAPAAEEIPSLPETSSPASCERVVRSHLYRDHRDRRRLDGERTPPALTVVNGGNGGNIGNGGSGPLRIAVVAPPWIPVPPPGYGGIESVIDLLCGALVRRGHDVTLFAAPGSRSPATVISPLGSSHPEAIGRAILEADHAARALDLIEAGVPGERPYDVIHDHSGFALAAFGNRARLPIVHTLHGPLDEPESHTFYRQHGQKVTAVAISAAQAQAAPDALRVVGVVPNPIDVDAWPDPDGKDDYLLWVGRMAPFKGPHRAIEAARRAGQRLILAGPIQPGQQEFFRTEVEPRLGDGVTYVGEIGGERKLRLFSRARALLMPIRWSEPFGMVIVEALAAGTPVIAFPEGAAPEIIDHGETGFLVADEAEMAAAAAHVDRIDPADCRAAARRFAPDRVAAAYEDVYRRVIEGVTEPSAPPALRASARPGARPRATAA